MSRQLTNLRESKIHYPNLKDFTYSVDIKKFSREKGNMTPAHHNTNSFYKKFKERSNQKNKNGQPTSLAVTFSKNISQKNMQTKRKLSSGFQVAKSNHHSVNLDQHLLKEKYNLAKELFQSEDYAKAIPIIKQIILHFQYSNSQKNLYLWLSVALMRTQKYSEAVEQISQGISQYPNFHQGYACLANLQFKLKKYKQAVVNFEAAIKMNNKNPTTFIQLACCFQQMKEFDKSIDLLKEVIGKFPKQAQLIMIFVECCIQRNHMDLCEQLVEKEEVNYSKKDSLILYIKGLIENKKKNQNEAYILFEQALKYNNNRTGVSKSLIETIKIEINKRDFYKAHHSISRIKFLQLQETEEMKIYSIFIEGVMTMMKKKSQQSIQILNRIANNKKCQQMNLISLINKYLGYGYFKISEYSKSIKYYQKISSQDMDESSKYNKLLAEGIELADKQLSFEAGISKFNQAKVVYPQKVEPYIYIAMVLITRNNHRRDNDQTKKAESLIEALKQLELGNKLNSNSSNLLYHRTIIHLYFQDWQQAHNDINKCIQKAQQNLPKYFYLRGVCYLCIKDYKKAINELSICLSLDANYNQAYLQKAKCYFLIGNTQKGFSSLKIFMEMNPDDLSIYKWIGDLLYEGMSYKDALKAYNQLGQTSDHETCIMRLKCMLRISTYNEIIAQFKYLQKNPNLEKQKISLDEIAFNLLSSLLKNESNKSISNLVKKLNKYLEQNIVGYIFQLIDCINLLGVASFYIQKYPDAYESFLLVLELYQSLCQKQSINLKSEYCDEQLDLKSEDIYYNIIVCQFAQGNHKQAVRMITEEYLGIMSDQKKKKEVEKIIRHFECADKQSIQFDFKNDKPINSKLKKIQIQKSEFKLKTKPSFNFYHDSALNLYISSVAEKMISQLHAGYIDNMPQGPWIKRNPYGVIFTEDVIALDNSVSFEDTVRVASSKVDQSQESYDLKEEQEEVQRTISKKQEFLKKLKFDEAVQTKLNNMIQKTQAQGMKKKEN